jgi:hypothetical protein
MMKNKFYEQFGWMKATLEWEDGQFFDWVNRIFSQTPTIIQDDRVHYLQAIMKPTISAQDVSVLMTHNQFGLGVLNSVIPFEVCDPVNEVIERFMRRFLSVGPEIEGEVGFDHIRAVLRQLNESEPIIPGDRVRIDGIEDGTVLMLEEDTGETKFILYGLNRHPVTERVCVGLEALERLWK